MADYSPAPMTDMYEYTILDAALKDDTTDRECVFEVFTRHLPEGRHRSVAVGTGRILDTPEYFHLDEADLKFLTDRHMVNLETIRWLENFHLSGVIRGYREDEMFFLNFPVLQVEGAFGERALLEALILSALNYDSAVISAASRMASVAKDHPHTDMSGHRTNERAAVTVARAVVVGGFKGTANLLAAQLYGLKAIGTAAHCFTLARDSERDVFESQIEALGRNTTLLVDICSIEEAVKTAIEMTGPELGGVRIDSDDLAVTAQRVRNQLDVLGVTNTTIIVTNDLDKYAFAVLQTTPVDPYDVGTIPITGSDAPTCAMVRKLIKCENADGTMVPVIKKSKDKVTVPGCKLAFHSYECALAEAEHVISGSEEELVSFTFEPTWKNLLVDFVNHGHIDAQWQDHNAIVATHDYRAKALSEPPITAQSLTKGEPVIPTETRVF